MKRGSLSLVRRWGERVGMGRGLVSKIRFVVRWTPLMFTVGVWLITAVSFFATAQISVNWGTHGSGNSYVASISNGSLVSGKLLYSVSHPRPTEFVVVDGVMKPKKELSIKRDFRWIFLSRKWQNHYPLSISRCFVPVPGYMGHSTVSLPMVSLSLFLLLMCCIQHRGLFVRYLRRRAGCCMGCGYSLVGLEGGVCPECGEGGLTRGGV